MDVATMEQAIAPLLAEVPHGWYRVLPSAVSPYGVTVEYREREGVAVAKAGRLVLLRLIGPDALVRCDRHQTIAIACEKIPVSWALLGHTCGVTP